MAVDATRWRIGVDDGRILVAKVPTVPADPAQGVIDALAKAATMLSLTSAALLARCPLFVHGSTIATNTVLEGKGAKVGLLTTVGFRDSLEIRRGHRENPWDHRTPYPPVLVPRYLRLPVRGRLDRSGRELSPVAIDDVDAAIETATSRRRRRARPLPASRPGSPGPARWRRSPASTSADRPRCSTPMSRRAPSAICRRSPAG
jgi:N-methylhydantoinase A/oxoprolinase/acetone carboxylase beta subunit